MRNPVISGCQIYLVIITFLYFVKLILFYVNNTVNYKFPPQSETVGFQNKSLRTKSGSAEKMHILKQNAMLWIDIAEYSSLKINDFRVGKKLLMQH